MNCGQILYAVHDGTYVLRLRGDVRATWCPALDALLARMFADGTLRAVIVDLRETTNIDSTMLGLLAKIAIRCRARLDLQPVLVGPNADIKRLLESMCLDSVFSMADADKLAGYECKELPVLEMPEDEMCRQVADAHRVLMDIDERNRAVFRDVVATLDSQQRTGGR